MRTGARCLLFLALVACDNLPAVQSGVCGNQVIDPNEDCDTFATAPGALCRSPGTAGQCRYACGLQSDGTTAICPPGMGCGTDGTCRTPSGTFGPATQPIAGSFSDLFVGDVDGDGRADLVGLEAAEISTFFDATLASPAAVRTPRRASSSVHPVMRDISGDGRADVVVGAGGGTIVDLGSASRAFVPTAFPSSYAAGLTNASMIVLRGLPPNPADTLFIMGTYGTTSGIALLQTSGQGGLLTLLSTPPSELAGPVAVGHLVENPAISPCDELAFAYVGSNEVDVYTACSPDGKGGFAWNSYDFSTKVPTPVKLSGGATVVRGPLLLDVNGDGHLDFLLGASRCSGCDEVDVAYGVGDGTFHSDPTTIPASNGDDTFATYARFVGPLPLAVGDLDGDGIVDEVTPTQVLVSQVNGNAVTFVPRALAQSEPWTEAVIADFNRDGILDVAAGSSAAANIDFYVGAGGGALDPFLVPTAPVRHFAVGDFDGDLVNDLAVSEIADPSDPLGDSVSILFGNAVGAPAPPISMGRFKSIRQTTVGKFVDTSGILSGTDTLLTTSMPNDSTTDFGTFAGAGDRVLRSPLSMTTFTSKTAVASGFPWRYAFGHFTSGSGPIDLAALDEQVFPVPPTPVYRLWLLPTDGHGGFDAAQSRDGDPLPDGLDWAHVAITAVDLDGSGTDQLVALGPSTSDSSKGTVAVARAQPGPSADPPLRLVFGTPTEVDALVVHDETGSAASQSGRALATDLDGDGKPDVVALASVAGTTSVVVFWNDHAGQLGTMTAVPNPDGHPAIDFAVLDAGGSAPSLAVLTDEGVSLASFAQRAPSVASSLAFHVAGGHRIAPGDVDGDGVTDLAVAGDAGLTVHRGHAVRP
ncbi:MAG TPA: VCBS repeat-containing protein [Polyangiaceae bacterium]|nr:VCBS repeat-containing protein [Polyangiaceae bacterium]